MISLIKLIPEIKIQPNNYKPKIGDYLLNINKEGESKSYIKITLISNGYVNINYYAKYTNAYLSKLVISEKDLNRRIKLGRYKPINSKPSK